ncbi:Cof-type HAD-IIB family hydrolase [Marmoricola sp. RAF53]|uniref:Cof-type HAD-IIB family hydrolase n=1 Tax=Marmoricola sp. RAF53 TaxID=3233059 RepID=UPI003F984C39
MTVPVRLIATDLDGTLVHSDGSVTPRTRAALAAAEASGVDVVFVTGRPLRWAEDVFEHVGGHGHAIISNGALLWDVAAAAPALERAITPEVAARVADLLREAIPGTHYAVETLEGIALETGFLERYPVPDGARRGSFAEIADRPAYKLLARHEELGPQEFWDRALEAAGDVVEITWSSTTALLEISAYDVTKASTLEVFCTGRGIDRAEVVAFGDMPNDLPMLAWAGTSYAMANAHPTVRAAADHLAPPNDEDGVAQVIERLLDTATGARRD